MADVRQRVRMLPIDDDDLKVLSESIWHAVQRGDVPDEDRERLHSLRDWFGKLLNGP